MELMKELSGLMSRSVEVQQTQLSASSSLMVEQVARVDGLVGQVSSLESTIGQVSLQIDKEFSLVRIFSLVHWLLFFC